MPARTVDSLSNADGDVALVDVDANDLPTVSLAPTDGLTPGTPVTAVGYPAARDSVVDPSLATEYLARARQAYARDGDTSERAALLWGSAGVLVLAVAAVTVVMVRRRRRADTVPTIPAVSPWSNGPASSWPHGPAAQGTWPDGPTALGAGPHGPTAPGPHGPTTPVAWPRALTSTWTAQGPTEGGVGSTGVLPRSASGVETPARYCSRCGQVRRAGVPHCEGCGA